MEPDSPPPPRLLDRVREAVRSRHYSRRTEESYVFWVRRYVLFHGKKHPSELNADAVTRFLAWLAVERAVSASTQNQALSALLFLYKNVLHLELGSIDHVPRAKASTHVPVVLSHSEVRQVVARLTGVPWLVVSLLYGAGLRLQECLELRVKDVDFERREIVIRRGKGGKDRRTMLPESARARLIAHLAGVRTTHESDVAAGLGRVVLPTRSNESIRVRPGSGGGSSCFRRAGSAATPSSARRRDIICTNRPSSARSLRRPDLPA